MSSNPNVLLRIFENSKPETCGEIEPDSDKRFYTQGQVKQIQQAGPNGMRSRTHAGTN
jgi:hypothetical protein